MSKVSIRVDREHANAGDVRVHLTREDGPAAEGDTFAIPGDVTPFTALRMLAPWLEAKLNPPDAEPAPKRKRGEVTP